MITTGTSANAAANGRLLAIPWLTKITLPMNCVDVAPTRSGMM